MTIEKKSFKPADMEKFLYIFQENLSNFGEITLDDFISNLSNELDPKISNILREYIDPDICKQFETICSKLFQCLNNSDQIQISSRKKSFLELFKKILLFLKEEKKLSEITDIYGIKCIIMDNNESLCYEIMDKIKSFLNEEDFIIVKESDYIKNAKCNGYKSLQYVFSNGVLTFEVQVKTFEMQVNSEIGEASHDTYKAARYLSIEELMKLLDLTKANNIIGFKKTSDGKIDDSIGFMKPIIKKF